MFETERMHLDNCGSYRDPFGACSYWICGILHIGALNDGPILEQNGATDSEQRVRA